MRRTDNEPYLYILYHTVLLFEGHLDYLSVSSPVQFWFVRHNRCVRIQYKREKPIVAHAVLPCDSFIFLCILYSLTGPQFREESVVTNQIQLTAVSDSKDSVL